MFPSPLRKEGRETVLPNLTEALKRADGAAKTTDAPRLDLHDGRAATCLVLFKIYATLLLEYAAQPARCRVFRLRQGQPPVRRPQNSQAREALAPAKAGEARCNRVQRAFSRRVGRGNR